MQLKTYVGRSVQDAVNRAKAELGDEILLLESRQVKRVKGASGRSPMEIVVALGEEDDREKNVSQNRALANRWLRDGGDFRDILSNLHKPRPLNRSVAPSRGESKSSFQRRQIASISERLRSAVSTAFPEIFNETYWKLKATGVDEAFAASLVRRAYLKMEGRPRVTAERIQAIVLDEIGALLDRLNRSKTGLGQLRRRTIALIGPSGTGKTTTVMKMALNPNLFGSRQVGIISADNYRLAAGERLKAFAKIAPVTVLETNTPAEAPTVLKRLNSSEVILVDLPSRDPARSGVLNEQVAYMTALRPTDVFLVLSLTVDVEEITSILEQYRVLNPTALVLTKMDEIMRPGKIVSAVEKTKLPLAYVTAGQMIPQDIHEADTELILKNIENCLNTKVQYVSDK